MALKRSLCAWASGVGKMLIAVAFKERGTEALEAWTVIEIGPGDVEALAALQERWPEVKPIIEEATRGRLWVRREP